MSTPALVAVLLAAALLASSRRLGRLRAALGLDHLAATGHLFLGLGYAIGLALGEVQREALRPGLTPIVGLTAGWIGFSVGMAFHGRVLKQVPARMVAVALAPAVVAAAVVGGLAWLVMRDLIQDPLEAGSAALVLGAVAATSSPTLAAAVRTRGARRSRTATGMLRLAGLSAGLDDAVTLLLALTAFALFHHTPGLLPFGGWWLGAVGLGVLMGGATWLFLGGGAGEDERLLLGLGTVTLTAGAATWLEMDAAVVCAIAGVTLVNLPGDRMASLRRTLDRIERPAVVVLMTVIGLWAAGVMTLEVVAIVLLLTVVRLAVKVAAARTVAGLAAPGHELVATPTWGLTLVPQGSLGLVVALGSWLVWHDHANHVLLAAVAMASVLNEVVAPAPMLEAVRHATTRELPAIRG